jgi:hypothetical protein
MKFKKNKIFNLDKLNLYINKVTQQKKSKTSLMLLLKSRFNILRKRKSFYLLNVQSFYFIYTFFLKINYII